MNRTFLILLIFLAVFSSNISYAGRRCTGSANCTACKNCSGCKYCNEGGGTCGVCSVSYSEPEPSPTIETDNSYSSSSPSYSDGTGTNSSSETTDETSQDDYSGYEEDEPDTESDFNWWWVVIPAGLILIGITANKK